MDKLLTTFLTLFLFACKQVNTTTKQPVGDKIAFQQTGLKETIDTLLKDFSRHEHGKNAILIEGKSAVFNTDSLSLLLRNLRMYDISDANAFEVYKKVCNSIQTLTWKAKESSVDTHGFKKYVYQARYSEMGSSNDIKITDFEIYTSKGDRAFLLRVANDFEFEQLSIGKADYKLNYYEKIINDTVYKPVFEERLLGLDEIEKEYETKKEICR